MKFNDCPHLYLAVMIGHRFDARSASSSTWPGASCHHHSGVVHMDNDMFCSCYSFERSPNEVFSGRSKDLRSTKSETEDAFVWAQSYLDPDIIGDAILLNQSSCEAEVSITSGRIRDFDLFEATFDEVLEEGRLLLEGHGCR